MDDSELIALSKSGNAEAYEELVLRYQGIAHRTAYMVTRDQDIAQDISQDAFLKGFGAIQTFQDGSPFRRWLLRIVTNLALDRQRMLARDHRLGRLICIGIADASPSAEAEFFALDRRRQILEAFHVLSIADQTMIAYKYFLGFSEEELAYALKCPRGTIKSRLSRSLTKLRRRLSQDDAVSRDVEEAKC